MARSYGYPLAITPYPAAPGAPPSPARQNIRIERRLDPSIEPGIGRTACERADALADPAILRRIGRTDLVSRVAVEAGIALAEAHFD